MPDTTVVEQPTENTAELMPSTEDVEKPASKSTEKKGTLWQLAFGAGGIYACFLYYGSLQEDVFRYRGEDKSKFTQVWFLQVLEGLANVIVGFGGRMVTTKTPNTPQHMFLMTGATQVTAKYCTNAALAYGLSFPVATLAKSAKMLPVMAGSLILGGASYTTRQYLEVSLIVAGTGIVSLASSKSSKNAESSMVGMLFILSSLACDGLTGGMQKRLKKQWSGQGYDFMFWTNLYMTIVAVFLAALFGEIFPGIAFLGANPACMWLIIKFSILSAMGQSFIFYTIAVFDPLVLATVTTTRKIFSVLISLIFKGHSLPPSGWLGVAVASVGIMGDIQGKKEDAKKPSTSPPASSTPKLNTQEKVAMV